MRKVAVTLVCGPPGGGKSTFVSKNKGPNDLVVDVDALFTALSGLDARQKPACLLPFVLEARRSILDLLETEFKEGPPRAWIIMGGERNDFRVRLAQRLSAEVIVLPVPVGECVRRMKAQNRPSSHIRDMVDVGVSWHKEFVRQPGELVYSDCLTEIGEDGWPVEGVR